MDRTCDLRFRKPLLYPLSYEGGDGAKCGAKFADTPCTVSLKVTSASQMRKETGKSPYWRAIPAQYQGCTA